MIVTANRKRQLHDARQKQKTRVVTPRQAAEVFVRNLTTQVCGDLLDLIEHEGDHADTRARQYADVKEAVRRQHQLPTHDLHQLRIDLVASSPVGLREPVERALLSYAEAEADEGIVRENAAYVLGVAIGRAFGSLR
jgi:hypothetical protein